MEHLWTARPPLLLNHLPRESHFTAPHCLHTGLFLSCKYLCLLKPDLLLKDVLHTWQGILIGSWIGCKCCCCCSCSRASSRPIQCTACQRHFLNGLLHGTNLILVRQPASGTFVCDCTTVCVVLLLDEFLVATQKGSFWRYNNLACVPCGPATLTSFW